MTVPAEIPFHVVTGMLIEVPLVKRLTIAMGLFAVAATVASGSALAWRGGGVRVWVGPGYYPYGYYTVPYYAPPPLLVVPGQPDTYVEQQSQAVQPGTTNGDTWYYCDKAGAYYPYVKTCPSGWRAVPAQPANR